MQPAAGRSITSRGQHARLWLLALLAGCGAVLAFRNADADLSFLQGQQVSPIQPADPLQDRIVAAHESAWFIGVPVAVLGCLHFVLVSTLTIVAALFPGRERRAAIAAIALACSAAVLTGAFMTVESVLVAGLPCLPCLATHSINALLAATAWWALHAEERAPLRLGVLFPSLRALFGREDAAYYRAVLKVGLWTASLTFASCTSVGSWKQVAAIRHLCRQQLEHFLGRMATVDPDIEMSVFDGLPSTGPRDAPLTIAVTVDFRSWSYRRLAKQLELLRRADPDRVRLIYVNASFDPAPPASADGDGQHDGSWLARGGECVHRLGRFADYHRLLIERFGPEVDRGSLLDELRALGIDGERFAGCLAGGDTEQALLDNAALCRRTGMWRNPSLAFNGYVGRGEIYPLSLALLCKALLERSQEGPLRGGTSR